MSIDFSWNDLGLAQVWIDSGNKHVLYDLENDEPASKTSESERLLRVTYSKDDSATSGQDVFDLHILARVLLPTLREHRLEAIRDFYRLPKKSSKTTTIARLFRALMTEALSLDREVIAQLARLLPGSISVILTRVLVFPKLVATETDIVPTSDSVDTHVHTELSIADVFATDGPIAGSFASFECRSGQLEMAHAVESAFRDGQAALVEAGPGTGKTFAYLIPAILHLQQHPSDRMVVSTRTRQLQEQLHGKDLPFLIRHLAPGLETALLKGRENYLCLRRWQSLIGELTESLEQEILLPKLAPLVRWMTETTTGDIEENSAFQSDPEARSLWPRLCDSPHHCTDAFCPFIDECFSVLARRRARRADLVVVNHSLLLSDLAVDGVVLGKYTHLVVDEAHTLEPAARMAFTQRLTERSFLRLADDLAPSSRRRRGWLQRTILVGGGEPVRRVEDLLGQLRIQVSTVFRQLGQHLSDERRSAFSTLIELAPEIGETPILLTQLEDALDSMSDHIEDDEPQKELEGYIRRVQGLKDVLAAMCKPPSENTVHWHENGTHALVFHATPLDVAPFLEQLLYPRLKALVLTSATLSLAGTFDYLCRSVGLSDETFPINAMVAASPFAFEDRMRIMVPSYFPPAHGELAPYAQALARLIAALAEKPGKKGLALFTSYAMMHAVKDNLPPETDILVQGELSRTALIDRFRNTQPPLWLLGTESFWEGVDFPGEELEILVITKLPFAVPTDPVLVAMGNRIASEGRDAFMDLSLPLAGLKLRQGVGRLIRTTDDRGLVFVTDQRIITRRYGKLLASSLPVQIETLTDSDMLLAEATGWFDHGDN